MKLHFKITDDYDVEAVLITTNLTYEFAQWLIDRYIIHCIDTNTKCDIGHLKDFIQDRIEKSNQSVIYIIL